MSNKDSNVTTLDDEVQVTEPAVKAPRAKAKAAEVADVSEGEFFNVTFYPTGSENEGQIFDVACNGYLIRFELGVPHRVNKSFKEGIEQMIVTTYHTVNGQSVEKHTPRRPFGAVPA